MILFFYGENDYLLKQKLRALKDKYKEASKGSFDLVTLDGSELTLEKFFAQIQTIALFAQTRLVVINQIFDAPKDVQDKLKESLEKISSSSVVVFVHAGSPDKRLGLFKALNKPKISEYFPALGAKNIHQFIAKESERRQARFAPQAAAHLAELVGPDPWQIANEIEKLAVYRSEELISKKDIDDLVSANIFSNTFDFIDALLAKKTRKALIDLEALNSTGEPPLKTLGAINFQLRLIGLIKDELERGANEYSLATKLKVNPYPLKKTLPIAKRSSWSELAQSYEQICALDEGIKTGKIKPEEALQDLVLNMTN